MSSEALERIRELAESGRLHTWDIRPASDGHMSAVEADVSPDVLALLAEVARLEQAVGDVTRERAAAGLRLHRAEQERDEARRLSNGRLSNIEGARAILWQEGDHDGTPLIILAESRMAALAVAREREQRAMKAMVEAAIPLEVLAGQIRTKPYRELTEGLQAEIERAVLVIRAALVDEPAAAIGRQAVGDYRQDLATLAEPEPQPTEARDKRTAESRPTRLGAPVPAPSGSASAAADEPAHKRPASSDGMGRTPPGGHATQDPEIGASTRAAADEPGETP